MAAGNNPGSQWLHQKVNVSILEKTKFPFRGKGGGQEVVLNRRHGNVKTNRKKKRSADGRTPLRK